MSAAGAVGLISLGAAASAAPATGATARQPPCTGTALVAGVRRARLPRQLVRPWASAGRFAYGALITHGNESTVLFRADGGGWIPVSRATYCQGSAVPRRIYQPACNSD